MGKNGLKLLDYAFSANGYGADIVASRETHYEVKEPAQLLSEYVAKNHLEQSIHPARKFLEFAPYFNVLFSAHRDGIIGNEQLKAAMIAYTYTWPQAGEYAVKDLNFLRCFLFCYQDFCRKKVYGYLFKSIQNLLHRHPHRCGHLG